MHAVASVEAVAGVGLTGDRNARRDGARIDSGEGNDVTLIEAEEVEALARSGIELAPGESRRNLTTRGIRLNELVGKEFWIGDVLARGIELCEPCTHLESMTRPGIINELVHRAGINADILTDGTISVGDEVVERS